LIYVYKTPGEHKFKIT